MRSMDWFETLTGFRETGYDDTRAKLAVEGNRLRSLVNGKSYGIGELELVSLATLRRRAKPAALPGRLKVSVVRGDVRSMHRQAGNARALFQVASQFNLLEMTSYEVTPEHGITRYERDHTQGPACAIAAGAAAIYRNYFAPVGDSQRRTLGQTLLGQTRDRQLDALADVGDALSAALRQPVDALWKMQNGYALCTQAGLAAITQHLAGLDADGLDDLRGLLRIGIHSDVEVTDGAGDDASQGSPQVSPPVVSQAFCSALPVAYTRVAASYWKAFASLVLEAAYEATMWAAVHNAQRGASNVVLLTSLGGGAFGNDESWIRDAMKRALKMTSNTALDVRIVSCGAPGPALLQLANGFG
jgi:hypothetical protein